MINLVECTGKHPLVRSDPVDDVVSFAREGWPMRDGGVDDGANAPTVAGDLGVGVDTRDRVCAVLVQLVDGLGCPEGKVPRCWEYDACEAEAEDLGEGRVL